MLWSNIELGTIAEFRNGINFNKESFGTGIKVINVKDFQDYFSPHYEQLSEIDPNGVVPKSSLLRKDDVVFVRSNGNRELIGRCMFLDREPPEPITHSAFTIRVRFTSTEALPRFYAYLFRSKVIRNVLSAYGSGTNISNLNQGILEKLQVPLPPLPIQHRISGILSAYDDLIENNTRRIKALEQAAHDLYREWFVEFHCPGHENLPLVDSGTEYGMIPQGWEILPVSQAIEINPRIAVAKDAEKPFIEMARLSESSMLIDIRDMEFRTSNNGSKFQNDDTLFARITPSLENGKTGYVNFLANGDAALGSTEFVVMRSRTLTPEYVYCLSRLSDFRAAAEKTMTGASGRQRVQNAFFDTYLVVQPAQDVLNQFQEIVSPLFDEISVLAQKNDVLREVRDLLLPRLMSGELDVSEVELGDIRDV